MIVKIVTDIFVEVADQDQAESAAATIDSALETVMRDFPDGDVVAVEVETAMKATQEEIEEKGLVE